MKTKFWEMTVTETDIIFDFVWAVRPRRLRSS